MCRFIFCWRIQKKKSHILCRDSNQFYSNVQYPLSLSSLDTVFGYFCSENYLLEVCYIGVAVIYDKSSIFSTPFFHFILFYSILHYSVLLAYIPIIIQYSINFQYISMQRMSYLRWIHCIIRKKARVETFQLRYYQVWHLALGNKCCIVWQLYQMLVPQDFTKAVKPSS